MERETADSKILIEASTKAYSITNPGYGIGYGMLWNVLMSIETRQSKFFYHTAAGIHMLGVYMPPGWCWFIG